MFFDDWYFTALDPLTIAGVLFALFLVGSAAGNFATSLVFRLPRNLKIANDPPYCDHCRTYLEERDKFPIFSWLFNKGKCRVCGVPVPAIYTWVEIFSALVFMVGWLKFGISEYMLIYLVIGLSWIVLASIASTGALQPAIMIVAIIGSTTVFRVFQDGTIYSAIGGGYLALFTGVLLWWLSKKRLGIATHAVPLMLMGMAAGNDFIGYGLVLTVIFWLGFLRIPPLKPGACTEACALASLLIILL